MRTLTSMTAALTIATAPALADGHYTDLIADRGITGAIAALDATAAPSASDHFARGGLLTLAAVENALQTRYQQDIAGDNLFMIGELPLMRLPIPPNPDPAPFDPASIAQIFEAALADLDAARVSLDQIGDADDVAVPIRPAAIWFDINGSGTREAGEGFYDILSVFIWDLPPEAETLTIRFDTADAAWLSAYTHVLSGTAELILATDPTPAITTVIGNSADMDDVRGQKPTLGGWISPGDLGEIDAITALLVALQGPLEADRTRSAHQHYLDALADNRIFWARLAAETDNADEWIPNPNQQSVLPVPFPNGIDTAWQAVLDNTEALLTGEVLLPHWRLGAGAGLNLATMFQNPPEVDVIGFLQGYSLAAYAQRGPVISSDSLAAFDEITGGQSPFFAIMLN